MPIDDALSKISSNEGEEEGEKRKDKIVSPQRAADWQAAILKEYMTSCGNFKILHPWLKFRPDMSKVFYVPREEFIGAFDGDRDDISTVLRQPGVQAGLKEYVILPYKEKDNRMTGLKVIDDAIESFLEYQKLVQWINPDRAIQYIISGLLIESGKAFGIMIGHMRDSTDKPIGKGDILAFSEETDMMDDTCRIRRVKYSSSYNLTTFQGENVVGLLKAAEELGTSNILRSIEDLKRLDEFLKSICQGKGKGDPYRRARDQIFERLKQYNPNLVYEG